MGRREGKKRDGGEMEKRWRRDAEGERERERERETYTRSMTLPHE